MPGQFPLQAQLRPAHVRRSPRPRPRQLRADGPCLPRAQRRRSGRSERAGERQPRHEHCGLTVDRVHCRSCCSEPEAALLIAGATGASGAFVGHRARPTCPRKSAPTPPAPPGSDFLSPACPRAAVHPWQVRNDARRLRARDEPEGARGDQAGPGGHAARHCVKKCRQTLLPEQHFQSLQGRCGAHTKACASSPATDAADGERGGDVARGTTGPDGAACCDGTVSWERRCGLCRTAWLPPIERTLDCIRRVVHSRWRMGGGYQALSLGLDMCLKGSVAFRVVWKNVCA